MASPLDPQQTGLTAQPTPADIMRAKMESLAAQVNDPKLPASIREMSKAALDELQRQAGASIDSMLAPVAARALSGLGSIGSGIADFFTPGSETAQNVGKVVTSGLVRAGNNPIEAGLTLVNPGLASGLRLTGLSGQQPPEVQGPPAPAQTQTDAVPAKQPLGSDLGPSADMPMTPEEQAALDRVGSRGSRVGQPGTGASGGGGALTPDAVYPAFDQQTPENSDLKALRAALGEPEPTRNPPKYGKADAIALAFLAGLKGMNAVLPYMQFREEQAQRDYEARREARRTKLTGLTQAAEQTGQDIFRQRQQELQQGIAVFNRQYQLASLDLQRQNILLQAQSRERAEAHRLFMEQTTLKRMATPTAGEFEDIRGTGEIVRKAEELIDYVSKGAGGPIEGTILPKMPWNTNTARAAALWGSLKLDFLPQKIGRATTNLEVNGVGAGIGDVTIASNQTRQLNALRAIAAAGRRDLDRFGAKYDPGYIYRMAGLPVAGAPGVPYPVRSMPPLPPGLVDYSAGQGDVMLYDPSELEGGY